MSVNEVFRLTMKVKMAKKFSKKIRTKLNKMEWIGLEPQVHSNQKKIHKGTCQAYNESKDGKKIKLQ